MVVDHNDMHALSRTPLDEVSARRRDLCLAAHSSYMRQTSMPPAGFEPTMPASERPQTRDHRDWQRRLLRLLKLH